MKRNNRRLRIDLWGQYPQDEDHSNMHQMCGIEMNHAATADGKWNKRYRKVLNTTQMNKW